jgi:hypothetical protein
MAIQLAENLWTLTAIDREFPAGLHDDGISNGIIQGQLPPEDVTEDSDAAVWAEVAIHGQRFPTIQYVGGTAQFFNFRAFFINDANVLTLRGKNVDGTEAGREVVSAARKALKRAVAPYGPLGRPPKYVFLWGDIHFDCYVESIGPIQYADILDGYGSQHAAHFTIKLRILPPPEDFSDLDEPTTVRDSRHTFTDGETFEELGIRLKNDQMAGVAMRQQSEQAFPPVGAVARIADAFLLKEIGVAPQSVSLQVMRGDYESVTTSLDTLEAARRR